MPSIGAIVFVFTLLPLARRIQNCTREYRRICDLGNSKCMLCLNMLSLDANIGDRCVLQIKASKT